MEAAARAAIVTVGSEIVNGDIANTNGRWLARELEKLGAQVGLIAAVPDDIDRIAELVAWARRQFAAVVVTGGLGATPDDVTREAIARACGVSCELRTDLARELHDAGGHMRTFAHAWARIPARSRVLEHVRGGAPPFAIDNVYVLAGEPREMKGAFRAIAAELRRGAPAAVWRRRYSTTEDVIAPILARVTERFVDVAVCSYPKYDVGAPRVEVVVRGGQRSIVEAAAAAVDEAVSGLGVSALRRSRDTRLDR